jgi:hypothetical protein
LKRLLVGGLAALVLAIGPFAASANAGAPVVPSATVNNARETVAEITEGPTTDGFWGSLGGCAIFGVAAAFAAAKTSEPGKEAAGAAYWGGSTFVAWMAVALLY